MSGTLTSVRVGWTSGVLDRILSPEAGLVVWRRLTRFNLRVTATSLRMLPPFLVVAEGAPEIAARVLFRDLPLVHWPLYADIRRLGHRFANTAGVQAVRMCLEHVVDNAYRRFHVDAIGLRLLCTYSGPGTEWIGGDGRVRRLGTMDVAILKGSGFPVPGPRVLHRSPALLQLPPAWQSRLVLCIDEVA